MKRILSAIALVGLLATAVQAGDIAGRYDAEGTAAGDKPYKAQVTIQAKGDVYLVSWQVSAEETYSGVGILKDKTLSVGWMQAGRPGIVVYTVDGDKLVGVWAVHGGEKTYTETLTKRP